MQNIFFHAFKTNPLMGELIFKSIYIRFLMKFAFNLIFKYVKLYIFFVQNRKVKIFIEINLKFCSLRIRIANSTKLSDFDDQNSNVFETPLFRYFSTFFSWNGFQRPKVNNDFYSIQFCLRNYNFFSKFHFFLFVSIYIELKSLFKTFHSYFNIKKVAFDS